MNFDITNITHYLKDDLALKQASANDLETLVSKYPYSGFLQLLYCKYLQLNNDIKLEQQVEKCALIVNDRKKMYTILFKDKLQQQLIEQEDTLNEIAPTIHKEISTNKIEPITETELAEVKKEAEPPQREAEVKKEETIATEKSFIVEEELENKNKLQELEENILQEAIRSSIQIDINDYIKKDKADSSSDKEEKTIHKPSTLPNLEIELDEPRAFTSWFDKPSTANKSNKQNTTTQASKLEKQAELSPNEMAKLSLVSNTKFVTETLATIFAKQGQINKAIEIYEQLSLKNPEKKTFFASRIRFLKEKQKYNTK